MNRPSPRRRRLLAVAALPFALALSLGACGDDGGDDGPAAAGEPTEGAAEIPEGRGVVTANDDGTRTVRSAFGTAIVPAAPKRVVSVIGDIDLETMLALGVTPVGAGTQGGTVASGFAPHLADLIDGVEPLAWADGAPVEAIAALRPDLIFAPTEEVAEQLESIAPVVPRGSWVGTEWKDDLRYVAAVLDRADDAEALLEAYETQAAGLAAELELELPDATALSAQVAYDHSQVYVDADDSFSGAVLTEVGFTLSPIAETESEDGIAISFEQLERLDSDLLFWQVRQRDEDGEPDTAGVEKLRANPLFARIPAVAAGRFHEVPNRPWYFPTILGAHRILADVEAALTG